MAQRVFFDPTKQFERRMFNRDQGDGQKKLMEPDYVKKARSAHKEEFEEGLIQHSLKRVKKKMNDYILSHYERMFFKK